jgi:hypothetical protein
LAKRKVPGLPTIAAFLDLRQTLGICRSQSLSRALLNCRQRQLLQGERSLENGDVMRILTLGAVLNQGQRTH